MNIWLMALPAATAVLLLLHEGVISRTEIFYRRRWHTDLLLGIGWFVLTRFLTLWIAGLFTFSGQGIWLYLEFLFSRHLPFWGFAFLGFLFISSVKTEDHSSAAFLCGYSFFSGIAVVLSLNHPADLFLLFFYPFIISASIIYIYEARRLVAETVDLQFWLLILGITAAPFIFSAVPFLYYRNYIIWSAVLGALVSFPGLYLIIRSSLQKIHTS